MPNPFQQRASEFQPNELEFLATLTPSLFRMTLDRYTDPDTLLTKTVAFSSPPGSGKTTLARFFQFTTLHLLLERVRHGREKDAYDELLAFAEERAFVRDGRVVVCGARVSLERDFRELSLLGYSAKRAHELMLSLLGARAVLAWRKAMEQQGLDPAQVRINPTPMGEARLDFLGGRQLDAVARRAEEVERILYSLTANFIPPTEEELLASLGGPFYPLLAIDSFQLPGDEEPVRPLLMIDDAHWADHEQHQALMAHLTARDVTMARWVFQRMEALDPRDTLLWGESAEAPSDNIQRDRTLISVRLTQAHSDQRGAVRKRFRTAASEIAARYLAQIPELSRHGIKSLAGLQEQAEAGAEQKTKLRAWQDQAVEELKVPAGQVEQIRQRVYEFVGKQGLDAETLAPAMVSILLHRQFKRAVQRTLFDHADDPSLVEEVMVEADGSVVAGAKVQSWHRFKVPYLGGADMVADLGTENVETFLQFAWQLVRLIETQVLIRGDRSPSLTIKQQHEALRQEAQRIIAGWSFPYALSVRKLVTGIARLCVERSREETAPLGGGANAVAVEQSAFAKILDFPDLTETLRFAVGYSALTLVPGRRTKGKQWTVLELGGPAIAMHGLTPERGGFVPITLERLRSLSRGEAP